MCFVFRKVLFLLVSIVIIHRTNTEFPNLSKKDQLRQNKLTPCRACRLYTDSFNKGMERTKKGKFEGGDAAWEEEKLRSYKKSEVRLVEIQELLCSDVEEGREQCYANNEHWDQYIEEWWLINDRETLFDYLCFKKLKVCCPAQHYGTACTPCPGHPDTVCGNHGRCKGAGTRKGNGRCACDVGYTGDLCQDCTDGYFESFRNERHLLCSQCHQSCAGNCASAGATGCEQCADGWLAHPTHGCVDVNECALGTAHCLPSQFCVNSDGTYACLACDKSCAACTGDGPDMCVTCDTGYVDVDGMCVDASQESRKQHVYISRYLTYGGLCVATCIIFQRSVIASAVVGLAVAVYITASEYVLNSPGTPNTTDLGEQLMRATNALN